MTGVICVIQRTRPHDYVCPQSDTDTHSGRALPDRLCSRSGHCLSVRARHGRPRFTFVSFPDPHHPFTPPGKYWDMYHPDQFEIECPYEAHHNPPPHLTEALEKLQDGSGK